MKYAISLALVVSLVATSCRKTDSQKPDSNPVAPTTSAGYYYPGEVEAGFVDTIKYVSIVAFIQSLGLEPIRITADSAFLVWIQVNSGNVNDLIAILEQDSAVGWAQQSGYSGGNPNKMYILAFFRGIVTPEYARHLIQSIPGISWISSGFPPRYALIKVEEGQEAYFVDSLKTYPIVTWVQLHYISAVNPL